MQRYRVADLTRDEFAQAMTEGRWLLLPFGAVEQHGPHLPLGTDLFYAEHICLAVAELVRGLVAPGFPYGICRTMRNFAGTVSLSPATFTPLLREILSEYVRHGVRKIALLAGHAEDAQEGAMREAALALVNGDPTLRIVVIGPYGFLDPIRQEAGLVGTDGPDPAGHPPPPVAISGDGPPRGRVPHRRAGRHLQGLARAGGAGDQPCRRGDRAPAPDHRRQRS